jgi:tetratricopeptide (TPR) repeat protein
MPALEEVIHTMSTTITRSWLSVALLAAGFAVGAATPALAMSAPSTTQQDNTTSTSKTTTPPPTCLKKGTVWDEKQKKCVAQQKGKASDQSLLEQGWRLARTGHYQLAIDLFMLMRDRSNPSALNGLGYANRKLGRFDVGIGYYQAALALDPDYLLAREYLGEGYAASGRIDLARAQLDEIRQRCSTLCEAYQRLDGAISDATKGLQ